MVVNDADTCQWCGSDALHMRRNEVQVLNAQVEVKHSLYACASCHGLSLVARWANQSYAYRAVERRRLLRPSVYIALYAVACAWCGCGEQMEPHEINATIANPVSTRHRYDIYGCYACQGYTAVSYSGEVCTYPATQDTQYHTLYYLQSGHAYGMQGL